MDRNTYKGSVLKILYERTLKSGIPISYVELVKITGLDQNKISTGVNKIMKLVDTKIEKSYINKFAYVKLIKFNDAYKDLIT